jgi:cob(I)alamin adenosyltransferase
VEFDSVTTGTGDTGETGTYSGERLPKDDDLFELLGTLDELNSWLGLIKAAIRHGLEVGFSDAYANDDMLDMVQTNLYRMMSVAATSPGSELAQTLSPLGQGELAQLEEQEKLLMKNVPIPEAFVNPGGTRLGATIDIARTVCRRAERRLVTWLRKARPDEPPGGIPQKYLNRLSDYLFVLARYYETG